MNYVAASLVMAAKRFTGWFLSLIKKFWNKVTDVAQKLINKLMGTTLVKGVSIFLHKVQDGFVRVTKCYSINEETDRWLETVYEEDTPSNEIPEEYKKKAEERMASEFDTEDDLGYDMTDEYRDKLTVMS
jgi:hypothetical protein